MENQQRHLTVQHLAAFSLDVTWDLYPWTLLRALLTEVDTTERYKEPCIPAAVSKFSNPKKSDLLVEEPERHCNKSEKEEVLPMASLEPELPRPKTVSGKQEVVILPKQLNEILEQSQKVPRHLESVPQQLTDVLEQPKQVPQKSMEQKQEIKRSEMILEKPNNAVTQQPNEINKQSKQVPVPQKSEPIPRHQPKPVLKKKPPPKECLLNATAVIPIAYGRTYANAVISEKTWNRIGRPKLIKTKLRLFDEDGDRIPIKGKIKVRIAADGEKGVIPIYVGKEAANLTYPLYIGTSGQAIKDFKLNSLFIDEKTEECLDKKGPLHWMTSKIGRKIITNPDRKG
jgi:hypothetical protein